MQGRVRRALVSVYEKAGVVEFCRALAEMEIEILSSGGTARLLAENGIEVTRVVDYTGSPEILGGRVKTLHPRIHGGILAVRSNEEHMNDLQRNEIEPIDLVVVNLYPFEKTAAIEGIGLGDVVEMIDIGGPAMVRAAAKNFAHVGVVVRPEDYEEVLGELREGGQLSAETRHRLSTRAFRHTAAYDNAVYSYLEGVEPNGKRGEENGFPEKLQVDLVKVQDLRYGENPHQGAAYYRELLSPASFAGRAKQIQGKELSFNNILDLDAALAVVADFKAGACAIIKHGNPCGAALGPEPRVAFSRALQCDPLSAFGGVIALNRQVDGRAAEKIAEQFYECIVAPGFDEEALKLLGKKKKLRLLEVGNLTELRRGGGDWRRVNGGMLVQDWDHVTENVREAKVVTERRPTDEEWNTLAFAWTIVRHVKSNAIVYATDERTVGIGAGQMSRVDSVRIGMQKAQEPLTGAVMASDAFFPFRDGLDVAAQAEISAVIQPGGSIRDEDVIAAANEHGMAMVFTGRRHFRH